MQTKVLRGTLPLARLALAAKKNGPGLLLRKGWQQGPNWQSFSLGPSVAHLIPGTGEGP